LSLEDSQQAHTYATHPDLHAEYYLLCNGREFQLYRPGDPHTPLATWIKDETDNRLLALQNYLSPEAIKKKANVKIDLGKPLARGLASSVAIRTGQVTYLKNYGGVSWAGRIDGLRNGVSEGLLWRGEDGLLHLKLVVESASAAMDSLHREAGLQVILLKSSDEYLSTITDSPTRFGAGFVAKFPAGTYFPSSPWSGGGALPIEVSAVVLVEAWGILRSDRLIGIFMMDYEYNFPSPEAPEGGNLRMRTEGQFDIRLQT
jgi:hypothetical protein